MRRLAAGLAVAALLTGGCAVSGINLVQDQRVRILAPGPDDEVTVPLTIRWEAERVEGLTFAVFVDRAPIKPGASLRSLAEDDDVCLSRPDCPDAGYLASKGVYVTTEPSVTLPGLPDHRATEEHRRDPHFATIVLIDGDRRVGESAWYRDFSIIRKST
ncbi:MAG TPA: hypothetical protein VM938_10950 [Acidimicrobiales bacterium]|nr:hypothetical protein [Acidimicrobiales bacterium]